MSMNVSPVKAVLSAVNAVAPKSAVTRVLEPMADIMPRENRTQYTKNIIIKVIESFAQKAKNKPDAERNIVDYILIVADKLKDINPMKYAA